MTTTFSEVWYLPHERTLSDGKILAYDDIGRLTVTDAGAEFVGKKGRVEITGVHRVSYKMQGRDFINHWVRIEHGGGVAFFADGRWRGWKGVFGGTRKILEAARHLERSS